MSEVQHVRSVEERDELSQLDRQKVEFAARGGKVQQVPYGMVAASPSIYRGELRLTLSKPRKAKHTIIPPPKEGWYQK